jgi:hypothetical protein
MAYEQTHAGPLAVTTIMPRAALEFGEVHGYSLNETQQFSLKVIWLNYLKHTQFRSWVEHQLP